MVYDRLFLFTYNLLSNIPQAVIYLPKGYCYNNNIILRGEVFPILKQLLDGVYVVVPETQPKYPYSNSMYFDDDIPAVIDLGAGGKAFSAITGPKVQMALISHSHFDHLHGDSFFPAAKFYVGKEELATYDDEASYHNFHGYDLWSVMMPGIKRPGYGSVIPMPEDVPVSPGFRKIPVAGAFKDQDQIILGKYTLRAIHLPGHTAGHYGFYMEKQGLLFSGDIDLAKAGPWYSNFSADVGDLFASVERIKLIDPRILVPSHRRVLTENILSSLDQYIHIVLKRHDKILQLLKEPLTIDALAAYRLVFPEQRNIYELFWEKMTVYNHLKYMLREGLITEVEPGYYRKS
jgi:ribonuclease/clavin/mitogillin